MRSCVHAFVRRGKVFWTLSLPKVLIGFKGGHLKIQRYLSLALQGNVVMRGLKFSVIVGTVLVLINHGACVLSGEINRTQAIQIGLTYLVPYVVSTLSSVQSMLEQQDLPAQ